MFPRNLQKYDINWVISVEHFFSMIGALFI